MGGDDCSVEEVMAVRNGRDRYEGILTLCVIGRGLVGLWSLM